MYAGFGTFSCDAPCPSAPYYGWLLGYKASDLTPAAIFCTSCAGSEAGIWHTGGGLVSDGAYIYFEMGNGPPPLGDSFLEAANYYPPGQGCPLAGSYTPVNAATLNAGDTDLESGGPVLFSNAGLLVGGGKQGRYYVIDTSTMNLAQDPAAPFSGFDRFQAFTNKGDEYLMFASLAAETDVESSVYWSARTGAYIVAGEIRQFWLKQGGPGGQLGYPTSDEMPAGMVWAECHGSNTQNGSGTSTRG